MLTGKSSLSPAGKGKGQMGRERFRYRTVLVSACVIVFKLMSASSGSQVPSNRLLNVFCFFTSCTLQLCFEPLPFVPEPVKIILKYRGITRLLVG